MEVRPPFKVTVVAASAGEMEAALAAVTRFWREQEPLVTVLLPLVVQFPAQLNEAPVSLEFLARKLLAAASSFPERHIAIKVLLCRNPREAIESSLQPHSVVLLGGRRNWRSVAGESLAGALSRAGHCVVFAR